jgi:hypothetical protein
MYVLAELSVYDGNVTWINGIEYHPPASFSKDSLNTVFLYHRQHHTSQRMGRNISSNTIKRYYSHLSIR